MNEELYRAVTAAIGFELIQVAASLYELLYCANAGGAPGAEGAEEASLVTRLTSVPALLPLLQAFPVKEDRAFVSH